MAVEINKPEIQNPKDGTELDSLEAKNELKNGTQIDVSDPTNVKEGLEVTLPKAPDSEEIKS